MAKHWTATEFQERKDKILNERVAEYLRTPEGQALKNLVEYYKTTLPKLLEEALTKLEKDDTI